MPRIAPKKCIKCSQLTAAEAQEEHGANGDKCWNPRKCHSKRTYYRHQPKYVEAKWQRRHGMKQLATQSVDEVPVELANHPVALMKVYRSNSTTDVHAVGVELWVGGRLVTRVPPVHCLGLTKGQVTGHLSQVLQVLSQQYGLALTGYGSKVVLDPVKCPLSPCPLHPERQ